MSHPLASFAASYFLPYTQMRS